MKEFFCHLLTIITEQTIKVKHFKSSFSSSQRDLSYINSMYFHNFNERTLPGSCWISGHFIWLDLPFVIKSHQLPMFINPQHLSTFPKPAKSVPLLIKSLLKLQEVTKYRPNIDNRTIMPYLNNWIILSEETLTLPGVTVVNGLENSAFLMAPTF